MNRLMLKIDEDELKDAIQRGELASAPAPVAMIMITLNEAHNLEAVLENLSGWAQELYIVDGCSTDQTVDIALNTASTSCSDRSAGSEINGISRLTRYRSKRRGL